MILNWVEVVFPHGIDGAKVIDFPFLYFDTQTSLSRDKKAKNRGHVTRLTQTG